MLKDKLKAFGDFWRDVVAEMKKTTWPGREELFSSTVVVIVSVILLAVFVGASDYILLLVMKFLIPPG